MLRRIHVYHIHLSQRVQLHRVPVRALVLSLLLVLAAHAPSLPAGDPWING